MRTSDLRNALERVAADTTPLAGEHVLAAGKRYRRRRRIAAVTASGLAVLGVAVVVAVGPWRERALPVPLPAASSALADDPVRQRYELGPETPLGPEAFQTMIIDRRAGGPPIELIRATNRFEVPPRTEYADAQKDYTISGTAVRIDVLGAEKQVAWVTVGNLYTLTVVDHSDAEIEELVAYLMQWYQRKR
ncbi:hypothetical protein AB0M02_31525 [Actinoplanes sp. NPDC051861]|uniref:hypothetical protein n=1 Tax=Actinoplanes sp. NPDC051861 TaxID=3155170 RepID=UPI003417C821